MRISRGFILRDTVLCYHKQSVFLFYFFYIFFYFVHSTLLHFVSLLSPYALDIQLLRAMPYQAISTLGSEVVVATPEDTAQDCLDIMLSYVCVAT
jgi:hypothetical protein